ncbi:hypothetical protein D9758_016322 [Tetrapyrgos nigripes]|uniref:Cytosine-purine permease n=1 Tax=Tetrapyrgos nigripes TaxID=182062 RepID=A0A8H5FFA3_9AGAR|nr:hypothetical protein D9758_016322 [Tetrapyrgos nigripes]
MAQTDLERYLDPSELIPEKGELAENEARSSSESSSRWKRVTGKLLTWGVETRGIQPVPFEERTDEQFFKIFFLWFTTNFGILSFSAGTLGPAVYSLSKGDSCLVILFFNLLCCTPVAYFVTWGPKLGMRQMIQARYSFGYYGVIVPSILNLIGGFGFCILGCIVGGQTLASVTDGRMSWTVGIVIITAIALFLTFCGYNVLNWYDRLGWIPVLVCFLVALGLGGKHLSTPAPAEPATAASVLSFGSVIAGFVIAWAPMASDFTSYYRPDVASWKMALYSYTGLMLSNAGLQILGAAVASVAPLIPSWNDGWNLGGASNVGGLLQAMLSPVGNFGKFLTVLLSLSVTANIATTMYSICLNFQILIPKLVVVPRYVFSLVATAIVLPLAIVGSHRFYDTLENFLALVAYWVSEFVAIVLVEHFVYRRQNQTPDLDISYSTTMGYNITQWNRPSQLPTGIPALAALVLPYGLITPSMNQVLFVGPIGEKTGDIGFEVAFFLCGLLYLILRGLEVKWRGKV